MKKKITVITLVVVMAAMLFSGLTLAYFTDSGEVKNVFTYGDVNIDLIEDGWENNPGYDSSTNALAQVFPGMSYDKIPYIENMGQNDAYVRIGVKVNGDDLKAINSEDASYNITGDALLEAIVDLNRTDWTFTGFTQDGDEYTFWYNYAKSSSVLASGNTTSALFTKITIPADLTYDQVDAAGEFTLTVIAQAVQTATFATAEAAFAAAF